MAKMKTHRGAAKRLKKTGTGLISRKQAFHRHKALHKSAKRKRQLRGTVLVSDAEQRRISRLLPYL